MNPCRILIVEDHPVTRDGISLLLTCEGGFEVVAAVGSASEALEKLANTSIDLVILDLTLPDRGGLEALKDIKAASPSTKVLMYSMHEESFMAERALRAGAHGYVMKDVASQELLEAVKQVSEGKRVVSDQVNEQILNRLSGQPKNPDLEAIHDLSDREFEVFRLIGNGLSTNEIAEELSIGIKTIHTHRARMREKLNVAGSSELINYATLWVERNKTATRP